jgi:hypothetical protein
MRHRVPLVGELGRSPWRGPLALASKRVPATGGGTPPPADGIRMGDPGAPVGGEGSFDVAGALPGAATALPAPPAA